ncbi:tail assembly chaperone [Mycobacterium phage Konstantine]|uniref:Tail assembly chaperone n=1 Tax=Mycobacterium phage Konstantine TaxID=563121 RepID=B5U4Z9_9CAUD|nr:tail assembly chaperone [Mycobacterium phage Konstantine]ACI12445.1 hypothetical protein KONSTANTINE_29 [Mycobacterium phage Konstantine]AXH47149.1 tail assembly chaperone [Mycobacterium phage Cborch11]
MTEIDYSKYESDDWGRDTGRKAPFEFTVPSGKTVLVKRLEMTDILKLGMIDDLDFMAKALVAGDPKMGEAQKKSDTEEDDEDAGLMGVLKRMGSGENFDKLERLVNGVVLSGVVAPKLYAIPRDDNARQKGLRYIDSVDFVDRMALFGVIFDSDGLSTFREESEPSVADLPDGDGVPQPAE